MLARDNRDFRIATIKLLTLLGSLESKGVLSGYWLARMGFGDGGKTTII